MNVFMLSTRLGFFFTVLLVASTFTPASSVVSTISTTLADCSTFAVPTTPPTRAPVATPTRAPTTPGTLAGRGDVKRTSAAILTTTTTLPLCPTDRCVISDNKCVTPPPTPCANRTNPSTCENGDGLCLKIRGQCQAINGNGQRNQSCLASLTADGDDDMIYFEVDGQGCAAGLVCNVANASNADLVDSSIQGFCEPEECVGKKVPGNCNGNNPSDPDCISATERVTICHRTCSEKNPWVRITIDKDAWNGEGCGHKQHDIRDECKNKAPWTEWGVNRKDYLLKEHGTRAEVAARLKNKADEKAYWKKWEPACPYVRNGKCCDWNDPENPCCGDAPGTSYTPVVEIKKYAGPPGSCDESGMSALKELYTVPSVSDSWQYCYIITVPDTSKECLYEVKMSDPAPLGGTAGGQPIPITSDDADFMCPGDDAKYVAGPTVDGLTQSEGPYDVHVTGLGVLSLTTAEATAAASVEVPVESAPVDSTPSSTNQLETTSTSSNPDGSTTTGVSSPGTDSELCIHSGVDQCPDNVVLMTNVGVSLPFVPIVITSQNSNTVTFTISNPFGGGDLSSVFYQYPAAESGSSKCYEESPSTMCEDPIEVTAHCMGIPGHPSLAVVDLWFVGPSVANINDKDRVPECCQPDGQNAVGPTAQLTFKIYCESKCDQPSQSRFLAV